MAKIAYLFGVSEYESWLEPLPAAVKDVDAMELVLRDRNICGFDQVEAFRNLGSGAIRDRMEALFTNRQAGDLVLLYFSGHGMTDQMGRFYFMAKDTEANQQTRFSKSKAIDAQFVHDLMENSCNSNRVVVILDCCHSGAFVQRGVGEIDFEQQLGGKGRIVLTASAATKYSFEQEGEELAIYTRYLVKGLKTGAADRDGKGFVTVDDLHDYVVEQLNTAASGMSPQRYVVKGDGEKIRLANAVVSDPDREYRKLVKRYCQTGDISLVGRRVLERKRSDLAPFGLTPERAVAIELEELEPYQQRRQNQDEYRETLQAILQLDRSQQAHEFAQLVDLEDLLKLSTADLEAIRLEVLGSKTLPQADAVVIQYAEPRRPTRKSASSGVEESYADRPELNSSEGNDDDDRISDLCEDLGGGISLDMVAIPGGSFMMGAAKGEEGASDREYPQHKVTIAPFWMGKFTVTQAQWKAIAKLKKVKCDLKPDPANFKGADQPVEQVSWDEAIEFCDRLSAKTGKRYGLPSEAQWEYACRSGTTTPFHFGETISTDLANYRGTDWEYNGTIYPGFYGSGSRGEYRQETMDVGKFPPNAFGLYDMHGNVWEWCADPWHDSYKDAPIDGSVWQKNGDEKLRMLRGGSWSYNPASCRSAVRYRFDRVFRNDYVGFRILLFSPQDS
jgi:formylglycine-generating enzyme required for sulfatase activity